MSDIAQVGLGTVLKYQIGSGSVITLSTLIDVTPPDEEVQIAEYQTMTAPSVRQKLAASFRTGDAKITLVHGAAMHDTLRGMRGVNNITWTIVLADGSTSEAFTGIIKKIGRVFKIDDVDMIEIELAVSGDVTTSP